MAFVGFLKGQISFADTLKVYAIELKFSLPKIIFPLNTHKYNYNYIF